MSTSKNGSMYFADALGFLNLPGLDPSADALLPLSLVHLTAAPPKPMSDEILLSTVAEFAQKVVRMNAGFRLLTHTRTTEGDIDFPMVKTNVLLGLQLPPAHVDTLGKLFELGVRVTQIAYDGINAYGGGFAAPDQPLTKLGEELIEAALEHGMIIDLSHAGHKTARDALQRIRVSGCQSQVMISHTGVFQVYDHPRNTPIDVMVGVEELGGVVGLYTLLFGLTLVEVNDLGPFMHHLERMMQHLNADKIVLGTDGAHRNIPIALDGAAHFLSMQKQLDPHGWFRSRYPAQPPVLNHPFVVPALYTVIAEELGLDVASGICGYNFRDFMGHALPSFPVHTVEPVNTRRDDDPADPPPVDD
jgi:microsomal dipeptidase-like Zn-dependent dipeptidase